MVENLEFIGNQYALNSGFNEWADLNDIIILYPYIKPSEKLPINPNGCWDWWGYTGEDYGTKYSKQVKLMEHGAKQKQPEAKPVTQTKPQPVSTFVADDEDDVPVQVSTPAPVPAAPASAGALYLSSSVLSSSENKSRILSILL